MFRGPLAADSPAQTGKLEHAATLGLPGPGRRLFLRRSCPPKPVCYLGTGRIGNRLRFGSSNHSVDGFALGQAMYRLCTAVQFLNLI